VIRHAQGRNMWSKRSCDELPLLLPEVEISHPKKKLKITRIGVMKP